MQACLDLTFGLELERGLDHALCRHVVDGYGTPRGSTIPCSERRAVLGREAVCEESTTALRVPDGNPLLPRFQVR